MHPFGDHRRLSVLLPALLALVVLAGACGSSQGPSNTSGTNSPGGPDVVADEGPPVDGGTLVVGVDSESSGWNPAIDRWATSGAIVGSSVLEALATLDADGVAQPWLATGWTPNESFDQWTITLRDDVMFHDSTPMDAAAVKANIDFIVDAPLSGVAMKPMFERTEVVDDGTVRVFLKSPWAAFPSSYLAGQSAFIRAPASMLTEDKGSSRPVGTGPFVFERWTPDVSFEATANRNYWRDGEPHLDAIEFRPIPDPTVRTAALEAGDIDLAFISSPIDAARLGDDFTVLRNWDVTPNALLANVRPTADGTTNPMSNIHARLAMAHAIDRDAIAASVGPGVQVPTSPFSPDNPWGQPSDQNNYPDHDQDAAKRELDAYRADTGEDALRVTMLGSAGSDAVMILQLVQQQLDAVGIESDIVTLESSTLISEVVAAHFQVALFGNYSSPDPDQNHYFWSASTATGEGNININFTGFTNDVTERALQAGRENVDVEVRRDAYSTLVEEQNANAANLWLYYVPSSMVAAPDVGGLSAIGDVRWANFQPKTWLGGLWLSQ
jgi:peptide/nickel transport system substrate-binding protein